MTLCVKPSKSVWSRGSLSTESTCVIPEAFNASLRRKVNKLADHQSLDSARKRQRCFFCSSEDCDEPADVQFVVALNSVKQLHCEIAPRWLPRSMALLPDIIVWRGEMDVVRLCDIEN